MAAPKPSTKAPIAQSLTRAFAIGALAIGIGSIHAAMVPLQLSLVTPGPTVAAKPPENVTPPALPQESDPTQSPDKPAPTASKVTEVAKVVVPPNPAGPMLSLEQLQALAASEPVQFVDARSAGDFAVSRLPGAVHLSPDMFAGALPPAAMTLDRSFPVVVYCTGGSCESSQLVAIRLGQLGFTRLHVYEGGFDGWQKAGLPIEPGTGGGK